MILRPSSSLLANRIGLVVLCTSLGVGLSACSPDENEKAARPADSRILESAATARESDQALAEASRSDLASILREKEPLIRIEHVAQYLQRADQEQLEGIRSDFEQASLDRGDLEYALFIEWWSRFQPRRAYAYTLSGTLRGTHGRLQAIAARAWTRADPEGAIAENLFINPYSADRSHSTELLDAVVVGWFESGKPGLEDWLSKLTTISDTTRGLRTYARQRVLRDGKRETLEWIEKDVLFTAPRRRLLLAGALTVIAHEDPALAIAWLPRAREAGVDTSTFAMRIAGAWGHYDPRAAMEWARTLTDKKENHQALRRVSDEWYRTDHSGFIEWLSIQGDDSSVDLARSFTVRQDVHNAPLDVDWSALLERAGQIVDPNSRRKDRLWLLQLWTYLSPMEATSWVEGHRDEFSADSLENINLISLGDQRILDRSVDEQRAAAAVEPLR